MNRREVHKGRGAASNPAGRFEHLTSDPVDDGWAPTTMPEPPTSGPDADHAQPGDFGEFEASSPETQFFPDKTRNLIAKNDSPDIPFSQSINPYKGCEHGCIYCYARPTHSYLDLSPGLDFETCIFYKTGVVERLREALDHPRYECSTLAMGTNTDPYQPGERRLLITRRILETLLEYRHPVSIVTKGAAVLRDLDVLRPLAERGLVAVMVSVTTLDNGLKTKLEPRTASPGARLRAVRALHEAGVPVGVMAAPMIPYINDHELESIVEAAANAGARAVNYTMLRLPHEVKDLFEEWLREHYPLKAEHVMSRVRDTRGGREYDAQWGKRMRGEGLFADLLAKRHQVAVRKHGLTERGLPKLRTDLFRPRTEQLALF